MYKQLLHQVRDSVSFITYISVLKLIRNPAESQLNIVPIRHASKLSGLNKDDNLHVHFLDNDKIVVNLSTTKLSDLSHCQRTQLRNVKPVFRGTLGCYTTKEYFLKRLIKRSVHVDLTHHGLPKMHKPDVPIRPIVSAIGSYTYNFTKLMPEILKPLSHSQYDIKDSFTFSSELLSVTSIPHMCSYDIVSLFTNIPINETIEISLAMLYKDTNLLNGLTRLQFKKLLIYCVKQNDFVFNGMYYDQVDGVAMGSPLGPILANIFISFHS